MTDRNELRRLAEASLKAEETWHHEADLHGSLACTYGEAGEHYVEQDAAYIAAASPEVVLGLLDEIERLTQDNRYKYGDGYEAAGIELVSERDQLREEAKHALVIVGNVGRELGQTQHERDQIRAVAVRLREAMADVASEAPTDPDLWMRYTQDLARNVLADPEVEKL